MTSLAPVMKLAPKRSAMAVKNGNTSSRVQRTSASPPMPRAHTDQRMRVAGTVSTPLAGALSGFLSCQSPAKIDAYSRRMPLAWARLSASMPSIR